MPGYVRAISATWRRGIDASMQVLRSRKVASFPVRASPMHLKPLASLTFERARAQDCGKIESHHEASHGPAPAVKRSGACLPLFLPA